eukprot:503409_1
MSITVREVECSIELFFVLFYYSIKENWIDFDLAIQATSFTFKICSTMSSIQTNSLEISYGFVKQSLLHLTNGVHEHYDNKNQFAHRIMRQLYCLLIRIV